jgi:3-dehydroquinate dehydratase
MRIMILNGPNLNLLGVREPHIYGSTTLEAIKTSCEEFAAFAGAQLSFHQSNHEGVLVDLIQSARTDADVLIINPAAYSFTSIAMYDALKIFDGPIFEVHISNIHARRTSSALEALLRRQGRHRGPRSLWLHRCDAGGPSSRRQAAGHVACGHVRRPEVTGGDRHAGKVLSRACLSPVHEVTGF